MVVADETDEAADQNKQKSPTIEPTDGNENGLSTSVVALLAVVAIAVGGIVGLLVQRGHKRRYSMDYINEHNIAVIEGANFMSYASSDASCVEKPGNVTSKPPFKDQTTETLSSTSSSGVWLTASGFLNPNNSTSLGKRNLVSNATAWQSVTASELSHTNSSISSGTRSSDSMCWLKAPPDAQSDASDCSALQRNSTSWSSGDICRLSVASSMPSYLSTESESTNVLSL